QGGHPLGDARLGGSRVYQGLVRNTISVASSAGADFTMSSTSGTSATRKSEYTNRPLASAIARPALPTTMVVGTSTGGTPAMSAADGWPRSTEIKLAKRPNWRAANSH